MSFTLVDEALVERLSDGDEQKSWLILNAHPEFQGRWLVEGFDPHFFYDLHEIIGPYRQVSPATLAQFTTLANDLGYKIAFFDDPGQLLERFEHLSDPPPFSLNSTMENTIGGMLPFQLEGFNFFRDSHAGIVRWSTGTGKTVLASSLLKYHTTNESFDIAWVVVKAHNKINTQRAIRALVDLDSLVLDGSKQKRQELYAELAEGDGHPIAITNYEKFRFDFDDIFPLFEDRRVLMIWDEMPSKLSSRKSQLYKSVCGCLYNTPAPKVDWDKKRPSDLRQYMLSATPVERDPEGFFNCVRLMDPLIYGPVKEFRNEFVTSYSYFNPSEPNGWHKLDKIGLKAGHIIHQADRDDPEIAAMFPKLIEEPYYIDWDEKDRRLYDVAAEKAMGLLDEIGVLPLIGILQMLCNAPSMLNRSAALRETYESALHEFEDQDDPWAKPPDPRGSEAALLLVKALGTLEDKRHTKIQTLRSLITEKHSDEKIIVFTSFNQSLIPIMTQWLIDWNISYVVYEGSPKQKQEKEDVFRNDPAVRVFLSSDQGADSLNLPEASVVIDYDLPWKYTTKRQRNRHDRINTEHATLRRYNLMMANSVEDRKNKIIERKRGYHEGIFEGAVADQAVSARITKDDLHYIFGG